MARLRSEIWLCYVKFQPSQNLCSRIKFTTNFAWRARIYAAPKLSLEPKFYDTKLVDFNSCFALKSEASARRVYAATKFKRAFMEAHICNLQ